MRSDFRVSDLLSLIAYSCRRTAKPPLPESRAAEAEARAAEASGEEATIKVVQGSTTRRYGPHVLVLTTVY